MPTNPYINNPDFNKNSEQNLIEDLTIEAIKFWGHDMVYIPRTLINEDDVFGEDTVSKFETNHNIEMYIQSVDGFEGEGDILSKFGLQINDTANFVVAKRRFEETFQDELSRPLEGDLLYFPLTKSLMEINYVEHENPFYQIGKNYVYKLTCEMYDYSHEDFETGNSDIDDVGDRLENPDDADLNDPFADNEVFEEQGEAIRDFDEDDPFAEGTF